ncbi:MAG: hypothetical protein ABFE01_15070 [Phycisphaerales bacterium]
MGRQARSAGLARADAVFILILTAVVGSLGFLVLLPGLDHVRSVDARTRCGDNLVAIGKAMLAYANDHHDRMPTAGGPDTQWSGRLTDWKASARLNAFGLDPNETGGQATISSSLYLLIRHGYATPRTFVCRAGKGVKEFDPAAYDLRDRKLDSLWDFGPNPARHCSYAYQMVYGTHASTLRSQEPGFAVAADRNPWMDEKQAKDFSRFEPDLNRFRGTSESARMGNSVAHRRDGQNVLFLDGHVDFELRPYCSVEDDNIYTISDNLVASDPLGRPPKLGSAPANPTDSLLVNDPPLAYT